MPYADRNLKLAHDRAYGKRADVKRRRRLLRSTPHAKAVARNWQLKWRYGITKQEFDKILTTQENKCGVCRQSNKGKRDWHVDHDHKTKAVRGVLCNPCNLILGLAKDSPVVLRRAADYLDYHFAP
jgi:hypothetical protein